MLPQSSPWKLPMLFLDSMNPTILGTSSKRDRMMFVILCLACALSISFPRVILTVGVKFYSFLGLNTIPLCVCRAFSISIHLQVAFWVFPPFVK